MKRKSTILNYAKKSVAMLALLCSSFALAETKDGAKDGDLKTEIKEYIAHHLQDSYDFSLFSYTNDQGQTVHSQYYPSGKTNAVAYVVDDPNVLFEADLDAAATQTMIGNNAYLAAVQSTSTGSTTTGNSTSALDASTVAATTAAFKIVALRPTTGANAVLVKINSDYHHMTRNTGV